MIRRILKRLRSSPSPRPSPSPRTVPIARPLVAPERVQPEPSPIPTPTETRSLVLYKDDYCGYCRRVYRALERLDVELEMADTRSDPEAKRRHMERTGRRTVPCLYIDDIPLFESVDIIEWLEAYVDCLLYTSPSPRD